MQSGFRKGWLPYVVLLAGSLLFRLLLASFFRQPGYTDAYYYTNVADSLWRGRGFRDDYIWNYLASPLPAGVLNNPSSVYWLPLTSILIYLGFAVSGGTSFGAAQWPNILISSALAPLAYYICTDIFKGDTGRRYGWLCGGLLIFCGIYAPYFALPDNFAPFALCSFAFLICVYKALRLPAPEKGRATAWLGLAGMWAGLAYLARVDGVLLIGVAVGCWLFYRFWLRQPTGMSLVGLVAMAGVFAATLAPWLWHNLGATGQLFPGGGIKTVFMREYNDFFSYDKPLDLPYYLNLTQPSGQWGWGPLLASKLAALLENLWVVGRGALFLFPLFMVGLFARPGWLDKTGSSPDNPVRLQLWRRPEFLPFVIYLVVLYLAMSLLFTFPGTRGSVFHSSGGLLPFIYLISVVGMDRFIVWLGTISRPKATRARQRNFSFIIVGAFLIVSVGFAATLAANWDTDYRANKAVGDWLKANEPANRLVMVPDPPAYMYANRQPSIVITSDSPETTLAAARRYGARYLMLQPDRPPPWLQTPDQLKTMPQFQLVATLDQIELYRIIL